MINHKNIDRDSASLFLSGVKIFLNLDVPIIDDIADRMTMASFTRDEYLIHKGNPGQSMMLIKKGEISVLLDDKVIQLKKGTVIGEMSLLSGKPSQADVIACTDVDVFMLDRNDFQELMSRHTELASVMTALMKSRLAGKQGIKNVGKYQILDQLGEGGMSIVYNAYDPELDREVAIKMLKYEIATSTDFKQRFKQEARTIARLNHQNILHVIETIAEYSTDFIVMEKLKGSNLSHYLKHRGVFEVDQTCHILYQVALALEHANDKKNGGIIHRDVKLSNIILDENGFVKLMDFGIASNDEVVPAHFEGTVLYTAPELLLGRHIDYRVDIYALGITAFAMLTGQTPFASNDINEVIRRQLQDTPPLIESLVPKVTPNLAQFINRALIKDPEQRISDWQEIKALLSTEKNQFIDLDSSGDRDMAIVIKINSAEVYIPSLLSDLETTLKQHLLNYDLDTVVHDSSGQDITIDEVL